MMSCRKCCGTDKTTDDDGQLDNEIAAEREEILLHEPAARNGSLPHGEQEQSGDEDYGKRKIRELVYYYINHCTLHGFHYVFETKSIIRKAVWLTILAVAAGFFFKEIKTSLTQYYLYPFTTRSTIHYPGALHFPAITICDFHDVRKSLHSTNKTKIQDVLNASLKQFSETLILGRQDHGFLNRLDFTPSDFYVFYSSKGQTCFTVNADRNNMTRLESNKIGSKYGIEFVLNVQHPSYSDVKESGFRIILHEHHELPLAREGFRVSPGYVTYVNLRLEKEKNLPWPYKTNCGGRSLKYFANYSSSSCYLELLTNNVIKICNCRIWFMPEATNASICSVQQTMNCVWPVWGLFEKKYNYSCPEDCEKTTYHAKLSSALFMPHRLIPIRKYQYLLKAKNIPNRTEAALEYIMENYAVVNLYFDDLRVDYTEQTPLYDFFKLVGDVGGQLGLVLGASFITLLELVDLFVMWLYFWLKGKYKRRSARRKR